DIFKNLENNKELHDFIYGLLIVGETGNYTADDPIINIGLMFGFLKKDGDKIGIANKIFEIRMTNYYISKESRRQRNTSHVLPNDVIKSGRFDMELCLCKFAEHYSELFNKTDIEFLERHGRLLFLMYLRPLINGGGFYHIESQLTDLRRMDIVVDYGRDQFIIELKLWRGKQYKKMCNECERSSHAVHTNRLAYEQLLDYMKIKKADKGYLLTFDFRKEKTKKSKTEWVALDGKKIFEVIV
ncbi:MAG: hypothetical protein FWH48_06155, partial [Oscillospiraceae bacterium]|nr:hypothetical protein [Oscillospiraceae bacterium]